MKKSSFFLGGALLLVSLFTTSCKEVMGSLDNPVSSYLTVNVADVTIPTGDTFQLKSETINSDNPITYKSSDETVATVDANGLVTGVADGEATILVSVAASQYYQEGTKEVKVAVKRPLTFEALEDGTISVEFNGAVLEKPIVYTKNSEAKVEITTDANITVSKGDKVEFQSANERITPSDWAWGVRIAPNSKCAVYGNVMSMISPDGNYHTAKAITQDFALYNLLNGNTLWEEVPEGSGNWVFKGYYTVGHDKYKLFLPATKLTKGCYAQMLCNTGITEAPELPATELADYCYQWMFGSCGNLTKVPELRATDVPEGAYGYMFQSCNALTEVPAINAKTLGNYSLQGMFNGCQGLTKAPALTAESVGENACEFMFNSCPKLASASEITVKKTAQQYAFHDMFGNCAELTESPAVTAESLGNNACAGMFYYCPKMTKAKPITVKKAAGNEAFIWMYENCYELTETPSINAETIGDYACQNMFANCDKLKKVNAITAKSVGERSFYQTFASKPELTEAVALNVETMGEWACQEMFYYCPKLTKAPALPAENLADGCYALMFTGCSELSKPVELLAATLKPYCYYEMFAYCYKFNNLKCLATTNADQALKWWLAFAGTDESVTTCTFTRSTDNNNWYNTFGGYGFAEEWAVPNEWTITPAITPASAPARRASAAETLSDDALKNAIPHIGKVVQENSHKPFRSTPLVNEPATMRK